MLLLLLLFFLLTFVLIVMVFEMQVHNAKTFRNPSSLYSNNPLVWNLILRKLLINESSLLFYIDLDLEAKNLSERMYENDYKIEF